MGVFNLLSPATIFEKPGFTRWFSLDESIPFSTKREASELPRVLVVKAMFVPCGTPQKTNPCAVWKCLEWNQNTLRYGLFLWGKGRGWTLGSHAEWPYLPGGQAFLAWWRLSPWLLGRFRGTVQTISKQAKSHRFGSHPIWQPAREWMRSLMDGSALARILHEGLLAPTKAINHNRLFVFPFYHWARLKLGQRGCHVAFHPFCPETNPGPTRIGHPNAPYGQPLATPQADPKPPVAPFVCFFGRGFH